MLTIHTPFYVATTYHLPTLLPPELDKLVDIPDPLGYGLLGGYDHTEHVSGPPQVGDAAELNTNVPASRPLSMSEIILAGMTTSARIPARIPAIIG